MTEVVKILYRKIDYKEQSYTRPQAQEKNFYEFFNDILGDNGQGCILNLVPFGPILYWVLGGREIRLDIKK